MALLEGDAMSTIEIIPAAKEAAVIAGGGNPIIKVAAYARVSTFSSEQEDSYESQQNHFRALINETPNWELTEVYADQASGLNTKKRTGFKRMMADAKKGKFNLLLVKSISRFARDIVTTVESIRELQGYGVEVRFQKESMSTASPQIDFLLAVMGSLAEQESVSISQNTTIGIRYKQQRGEYTLAYSTFLGYDRGEDGKLVINPEQAETVKLIYDRFLSGVSLEKLAKDLESEGRKTGTGSTKWEKTSLARIITNEKMCGDARLAKSIVVDLRAKKRAPNKGQVQQVYVTEDHEPIIDRQTWLLAQGELARRSKLAKGEEAPGPVPRWGNNDFTRLVRCPKCGAFMNRHLARKERVWKCHNRADGNGCKSEIVKEKEMQDAALLAAQMLHDKHPMIRHRNVPELSMRSEEKTLIEAAAIHADNALADRIVVFLGGERPTEYDASIPLMLLERVDFSDTEWTFRFWGKQTIKVPREARPQIIVGRRLKRS